MYERCRISHCSGVRKERRPATRPEPRKTDSWVNAIKKRADSGKRKASITRKADRKEIYFYLAVQHGEQKQHMSLQRIFLEKQHELKIKLFRVPEACNSSVAKDVGFVL
jgi:hypothetical protein